MTLFIQRVRLKIEIALRIIIADILNHILDSLHLAFRYEPILDIATYKITEDAAEILMARI